MRSQMLIAAMLLSPFVGMAVGLLIEHNRRHNR